MSEQPEYRPPNFTVQEASQYKADIDSSIALLGRIAAAFAPHEKPAIAKISEVTTVADVAGNLDGTYFTFSSPTTDFYIWFNATDLSGSSDPGLSGATGIQIDYTSDDSAATIAAAMNTAIDAQAELNSSVASDIVTISNRDQGSATDIVDIDTGFSFAIITQGGDGPDDLDVYIDAGYVLNNAVGGDNGLEEIAAQTILSISAPSVNPRIDRIVIDSGTGVAELVAGSEAVNPIIPDLPAGKFLCCYITLQTTTTIITNSLITDERISISIVIGPQSLADSNKTFTVGDMNKEYFISPTTTRILTLPTTGVVAGQKIKIHNLTAAQKITIEASSGGDIATFQNGSMELLALQATPTTASHWRILDLYGGAKPLFKVNKGGSNQNFPSFNWTKVTWSTEVKDNNNNFASGTFTPEVPGEYEFDVVLSAFNFTSPQDIRVSLYKNGSEFLTQFDALTSGNQSSSLSCFATADGLTDYFEIWSRSNNDFNWDIQGNIIQTFWHGALIH